MGIVLRLAEAADSDTSRWPARAPPGRSPGCLPLPGTVFCSLLRTGRARTPAAAEPAAPLSARRRACGAAASIQQSGSWRGRGGSQPRASGGTWRGQWSYGGSEGLPENGLGACATAAVKRRKTDALEPGAGERDPAGRGAGERHLPLKISESRGTAGGAGVGCAGVGLGG